jgi:hypothetical protein
MQIIKAISRDVREASLLYFLAGGACAYFWDDAFARH